MQIDIMFAFGITLALITLSYLMGMKFNYHRMQIKMAREHITELESNYNRLRSKHAKMQRDYENPEINVAEGSTLTESIHALINVLPPKWKHLVEPFEPSIMKEINSNPDNERKIRDAISKFTKEKGVSKKEEERITI